MFSQVRVLLQHANKMPLVTHGLIFGIASIVQRSVQIFAKGNLYGMRLAHFHVYKSHVADKTHVCFLQIAAEYAIIETRHEEQSGHARFGHAHKAHKRAEKAVKEKIKMIQYIVELVVAKRRGSL